MYFKYLFTYAIMQQIPEANPKGSRVTTQQIAYRVFSIKIIFSFETL
jgi:hypothetical protein